MHCLYGGYNLHRFSDALGLVICTFHLFFFFLFISSEMKVKYLRTIFSLTI